VKQQRNLRWRNGGKREIEQKGEYLRSLDIERIGMEIDLIEAVVVPQGLDGTQCAEEGMMEEV
jgi:hypothetical protein